MCVCDVCMYGGSIHTQCRKTTISQTCFDILTTVYSCSLFLAVMPCILLFIIKNMILIKDSQASLIYQRDSQHQNGFKKNPRILFLVSVFISSQPVFLSSLWTPSVARPSASEYLHILLPPSIFQVLYISADA